MNRYTNLKLRRAGADDARALARVHVASWHAAYRGIVPASYLRAFTVKAGIKRFRQFLAADSGETYVAEAARRILGFLTLGGCRDQDLDHAAVGEIWGIYILPRHWRKGIGSFLCRQGEGMLASRGCSEAALWVLEANGPARRFYEAMGFKRDGASKEVKFGISLMAVRYRKKLKAAG